MKKIIAIILAMILTLACFTGCNKNDKNDEGEDEMDYSNVENPIATIVVEGYGTITVELYPDKAPMTVRNFIYLANQGFYDGLIFHRVIEDFMIQGGDPNGIGTGGPGYCIYGEFSANGFEGNDISHERGVISMARSSAYDSAGSQFFIMHETATYLDGQYAAFGKVTDEAGLAVVDAIATVATNSSDKPKADVVIKSITVDTKGVEYAAPEKLAE